MKELLRKCALVQLAMLLVGVAVALVTSEWLALFSWGLVGTLAWWPVLFPDKS